MRGYRPGRFADSLYPDQLDVSLPAEDPERVRRIVAYAEQAANGQPLFEVSTKVPVRVHNTRPAHFRTFKAKASLCR